MVGDGGVDRPFGALSTGPDTKSGPFDHHGYAVTGNNDRAFVRSDQVSETDVDSATAGYQNSLCAGNVADAIDALVAVFGEVDRRCGIGGIQHRHVVVTSGVGNGIGNKPLLGNDSPAERHGESATGLASSIELTGYNERIELGRNNHAVVHVSWNAGFVEWNKLHSSLRWHLDVKRLDFSAVNNYFNDG